MAPIIEEMDRILATPSVQTGIFKIAMSELSSRALVWVSALGGAAMWGFAVWHPEPLRLVAATGYCLCLLLPVLYRDEKG